MLILASLFILVGAIVVIANRPKPWRDKYKVGSRPQWMNVEQPTGRYVDWSDLSVPSFKTNVAPAYTRVAAMLSLAPEICTLYHGLESELLEAPALAHAAAIVYYCSGLIASPVSIEEAFLAAAMVYYEPNILTDDDVVSDLVEEHRSLFRHQPPLATQAFLVQAQGVLESIPVVSSDFEHAALSPKDTTGPRAHRKIE